MPNNFSSPRRGKGIHVLLEIFFKLCVSQRSVQKLACVHYFLSNFYFSPNDSPSKTMKNDFISSKKLFLFLRHFVLEKNLKVHEVIDCLNKNLITFFVWYLEKEIRCGNENFSINTELNKEHFYGKIKQKMCIKSYLHSPF